MYQFKKLNKDLFWIGGNDRRLALFESAYPIPDGVSYNSYFIDDEKTVVLDTVDKAVSNVYFENIEKLLNGRHLDYLIINHMEPDHSAMIKEIFLRFPDVKLVCNQKSKGLINQFFGEMNEDSFCIVNEGDTISTGNHKLTFVMAPMVHWPEVMVTYDLTDKVLYSADAFGTFGALSGNIFADELDFEHTGLDEARRYYTNIVGKYGVQVQSLLKKAAGLEISMLCPLHGPIFRKKINWFTDKYYSWSSYTPECDDVVIAYSSIYGNTENACYILANALSDLGLRIHMHDVSVVHPSIIVADAFKCRNLVFAAPTYNAGIFSSMEAVLLDIKAHNLRNRNVAIIENGSWGPTSGKLMKDILSSLKDINFIEDTITIKSSVKESQQKEFENLALAIKNAIPSQPESTAVSAIDPNAMYKLSFGIYLVSANENGFDNGCIINTAMMITDSPKRISICVNKSNLTHDNIINTGVFNLSMLTRDAESSLIEHFGYQSGRDTDKFKDYSDTLRSENGILYLTKYVNSVISAKVFKTIEFETHTLFLADVTEAKLLSPAPSMTYDYYYNNVKPKPQPTTEIKKGFRCKVCGYVYEGDNLPADYICPLCKHGADDFEPIG